MQIIGLTGGIASGKSTVSSILKELGASVIDADILSRKVVSKGENAYNNIVKSFGRSILLDNGEIDRKRLGGIVFSDKQKLELLNSITHPQIIEEVKQQLERLKESNTRVIVIDAAILIEMGLHLLTDEIWLVIVNKQTQIKRLMLRDNFQYNEAMSRINSQLGNDEKIKYADVVIDNNKSLEDVRKQIEELWNKLISRRDS